jgi:hypothetical protein
VGTPRADPIPAFLSIDVEPDGLDHSRGRAAGWTGYDAMIDFAERLRLELTRRGGAAQAFGWFVRTDPQIGRTYGRPEHALAEYPQRVAALVARGDYFGVHPHTHRLSARRRRWVHEFSDREYIVHATASALDAYSRWRGAPARHFRGGAGFLTNDIVAVAEQRGVKVDLTIELGVALGFTWWRVPSAIDDSPIVGRYMDCSMAPRVPFRPAPHDFRVPGGRDARDLVMIPLTTGPAIRPRPAWRRLAKRLILGRDGHEVLYPSDDWPSARFYWDLVERQLASMDRPHVSLAIRTDPPDSVRMRKVQRVLEELPAHPLSERLRFVDPLPIAADLATAPAGP